jgi:hypothetical protein
MERMAETATISPAFVIKAEELASLNYLDHDHPRPRQLEWINRGTDQVLKPSTVDMLLRTLFRDVVSPSVLRLHQSAGLRAIFRTERDRDRFASAFAVARKHEVDHTEILATAIYDDREHAERAVTAIKESGVPDKAISLLWRASRFLDTESDWLDGHTKLSVAGAIAGSGIAGAMLGVAILAIPGVGPVAAAGVLATSAFSSVAAVSGIIGATGGAIARMLTDHDVDGVSASFYEQEIRRGKVFVSVDTRLADRPREAVLDMMQKFGGRTSSRRS